MIAVGAPGSRCSGAMKKANVSENIPGPINMAIPRSDAIAPCSSPCSEGDTRRVISDCVVECLMRSISSFLLESFSMYVSLRAM